MKKSDKRFIVRGTLLTAVSITIAVLFSSCASLPFYRPPCDPSRFDMTSFKGRMAHHWCEVKEGVKKI